MFDLLEKCFEKKFDDLYHVSWKNLGSSVTLNPRVPSQEQTLGEEDEVTPRVSLAPTIANCLSALGWDADEYYVYKLVNNPKLHEPTEEQVSDVQRTKEIWALSPATFKLVYKIRFKGLVGRLDTDYSDYEILEEY